MIPAIAASAAIASSRRNLDRQQKHEQERERRTGLERQQRIRQQKITSSFNEALKAYNNNDIVSAASQFETVIKIEPHHSKSLWHLALLYEQDKQYDLAISYLKKILFSFDIHLEKFYFKFGSLYEKTGNLNQALSYYKKLAELPNPPYNALIKMVNNGLLKNYYAPLLEHYAKVEPTKLTHNEKNIFETAKEYLRQDLIANYKDINLNSHQAIEYKTAKKSYQHALVIKSWLDDFHYYPDIKIKVDHLIDRTNPGKNLNIKKDSLINIVTNLAKIKLKTNCCAGFFKKPTEKYDSIMLSLQNATNAYETNEIVSLVNFLTVSISNSPSLYQVLTRYFPENKSNKQKKQTLTMQLNDYADNLGYLVDKEIYVGQHEKPALNMTNIAMTC